MAKQKKKKKKVVLTKNEIRGGEDKDKRMVKLL